VRESLIDFFESLYGQAGRRTGDQGAAKQLGWPLPPEWDENEEPVREIDHTDDDPGPDRLREPELREWSGQAPQRA